MKRLDRTLVGLTLGLCVVIAMIVPGVRIAVNRPSDPQMCASCHSMVPAVGSISRSKHSDVTCATCHLPKDHFSQLATPILDDNCSNVQCHPRADFYDVDMLVLKKNRFNHKLHYETLATGGAMTCVTCHLTQEQDREHFSTVVDNCLTCHHANPDVSVRHSCESCHQASVRFLTDVATGGLLPSAHARGASCTDCHVLDVPRGRFLSEPAEMRDRCVSCHADKPLLVDKYDKWREKLESLEADLAEAIGTLERQPDRDEKAENRLRELKKQRTLLRREGMHNIDLAKRIHSRLLSAYGE